MLWDKKRSLIAITVSSHRSRRRKFNAALRDPRFAHIACVRLERPAAMRAWLLEVLAAYTKAGL